MSLVMPIDPLGIETQTESQDPLGIEKPGSGESIPKPKWYERSVLGLPTSEDIPSGAGTTHPEITIPISVAAKQAADFTHYITTPKGAGESILAIAKTPFKPLVTAKWAYDMLKSGVKSAEEVGNDVAGMLGRAINNDLVTHNQLGIPETLTPEEKQQEIQKLAEDSVSTAVGLLGGGSLALHTPKTAVETIKEQKGIANAIRTLSEQKGGESEHLRSEALGLPTETVSSNRLVGTTPQQETPPPNVSARPGEARTQVGDAVVPVAREGPSEPGAGPEMGAAGVKEIPETGRGRDITGIAQRVREEEAKAGEPAVTAIGQGISKEESVDNGRRILAQDPTAADKAWDAYTKNNRAVTPDGMAVMRARNEQLKRDAQSEAGKFGTDSPEYRAAFQQAFEHSAKTKAMQTSWHETGQAQQGATDIDTGNFVDLALEHKKATGRDFTKEQEVESQAKARSVRNAEDKTGEANDRLTKALGFGQEKSNWQEAVDRFHRENGPRLAKLENDMRLAEVERKKAEDRIKINRDAEAAETFNKPGSEAIRTAQAARARKAELAALEKQRQAAEVSRYRAQKAIDVINQNARRLALKAAEAERKRLASPETPVWDAVRKYFDTNEARGWRDITQRVSNDLGMPVDKVRSLLLRNKRVKAVADEVLLKRDAERKFKLQAKAWLFEQQNPAWKNALSKIPRWMFTAKVLGHGGVALGTHAPMLLFQPKQWGIYFRDFGQMHKMVWSKKFHARMMDDLVDRKNYARARNAGLFNDPEHFDDYSDPRLVAYMGKLSGAGNRGYDVLKVLRQDLFDQYWDNANKRTKRSQSYAEGLARAINHATGIVGRGPFPGAANFLFAPRLELSRAQWLARGPGQAVMTALDWKNASDADKAYAVYQMKEKATVFATGMTLLALNDFLLQQSGSDQQINWSDPMKSDYLKFKAFGLNLSYGNPMITMARLPLRLWHLTHGPGGKTRYLIYPDETFFTELGKYVRTQLSPAAGLGLTLLLQSDFQNRPLPNSERPVPKRLKAQGVGPYDWAEFISEQAMPIPVEEGLKEVWRNGFGLTDDQIEGYLKALAITGFMMGTGGRMAGDWESQANPFQQ